MHWYDRLGNLLKLEQSEDTQAFAFDLARVAHWAVWDSAGRRLTLRAGLDEAYLTAEMFESMAEWLERYFATMFSRIDTRTPPYGGEPPGWRENIDPDLVYLTYHPDLTEADVREAIWDFLRKERVDLAYRMGLMFR